MNLRLLSTTLVVLLSLVLVLPVRGDFSKLSKAELSFGEEYPEVARKAVRRSLETEGCQFLGGARLNGMTSLRYQGDTAALNRFLNSLSKCLDVTLRVSFSSTLDPATDWRLFHEPHANRFRVEIAHTSSHIELNQLVIPEIGKPSVGIH